MRYCGSNETNSLFCCWNTADSTCDCSDPKAAFALPRVEMFGEIISTGSGTSAIATRSDFTSIISLPAATSDLATISSTLRPTSVPNTTPHSENSLSPAAKIGIGIGAGIFGGALIASIIVLLILLGRYRKRINALEEPWRRPRTPGGPATAANVLDKAEVEGEGPAAAPQQVDPIHTPPTTNGPSRVPETQPPAAQLDSDPINSLLPVIHEASAAVQEGPRHHTRNLSELSTEQQ